MCVSRRRVTEACTGKGSARGLSCHRVAVDLTPRPCQTHQSHQSSPNSHFFSRSMCKYHSPRPFTALVEVNRANHHCKALITTLVECPSITYKQSHMHTSSQEGEALHISHIRHSTSDAVPRSAYISTGTVAAKQNLNRNSRS